MTCDKCQAEVLKWLDHRGPLQGGIRIQQIGNTASPTHTNTRETVRRQLKLIRDYCKENH